MFGLSKSIALLLSFFLGFAVCAGALVGGSIAFFSKFKVRDLEKRGIAIPDEKYFGEDPEVDLLNLTVFELADELKYVNTMEGGVTINLLQSRYSLIIHDDIDVFLSEEAKNMPLSELVSDKGVHKMLSTIYIGYAQKYECHAIDSNEKANPADGKELTRWYDPRKGEYITGINATLSYFTLEDFSAGNINVDTILDGVIIADMLGYTSKVDENGKKTWFDKDGDKIKGVMAVFADCTINEVNDRINTVKLGEILGYEEVEEGIWYEEDAENNKKPLSNFMNKIANSSLQGENSLGNVFSTLTIGDIVDEEERQKGIFSIIPADTKIDEIDKVVNDSITESPMQFFMNQGMISFPDNQKDTLDKLCMLRNEYVVFDAEDETFNKYYNFDGADWEITPEGKFIVPTWRTKALNESFSYIVGLLQQ